jgi:hypothetical protein
MTYTVIDPGAMVVHLEDTLFTDPAVVRSRWFESFAVLAVSGQRRFFLLSFHHCGIIGGILAVIGGSIPDF